MPHEHDLRLEILNTLLITPHRELAMIWPVHHDLAELDPRFYVRLAAWYHDHGDVRDHKEMFIIALVLSGFEGHRDVGLALLRKLPPYQVVRVLDFIHGRKSTRRVRVKGADAKADGDAANGESNGSKVQATVATIVEEFGLFRNPPRALRTEIVRYLREREADPDWFDGSVLVAPRPSSGCTRCCTSRRASGSRRSSSTGIRRLTAGSSPSSNWPRPRTRSTRPARSSSTRSPIASPARWSSR